MTEPTKRKTAARRRTRPPAEPVPAEDLELDDYEDDEDEDYEPAPVRNLNRASRRRAQRQRNTRPPSTSDTIVIESRPVKQIKVKLYGEDYMITPPKTGPMLEVARRASDGTLQPGDETAAIDNWIIEAFGEDDGEEIIWRLGRPREEEELDLADIQELMSAVSKKVTRQPPT